MKRIDKIRNFSKATENFMARCGLEYHLMDGLYQHYSGLYTWDEVVDQARAIIALEDEEDEEEPI